MVALVVAVIVGVGVGAGSVHAGRAAPAACLTGEARSLVLISARTGAIEQSFPGIRGANVVLADGHGGWFVGGSVSCFDGLNAVSVLHLDRTGRLDRTFRVTRGAPISVLALSGSALYAAGGFGVEAVNAATGARRWLTRVSGGMQPRVSGVAANSEAVYIGGAFTDVSGVPQPPLVALDARTGKLLDWRAPTLRGGLPATSIPRVEVDAVALDGSRLFIGSNTISSVGGRARPGIAALDARTGALTAWRPGNVRGYRAVGDVETILIAHGEVFTAGHDGFGVTNAASGKVEKWMNQIEGVASHFAAAGDIVYLGADIRNSFTAVARQARNNLAAIDLATGHFTSWAPDIDTDVAVGSMAASRDRVLVAGSFSKTLG